MTAGWIVLAAVIGLLEIAAATSNDTDIEPTDPIPYGPYIVDYNIEYPDADCFMTIAGTEEDIFPMYHVPDPLLNFEIILQTDITLDTTYNVQQVMEASVDINETLSFSVTYEGSELGYFVRAIRGLKSNSDCKWFLYYRAPNTPYPFIRSKGVSLFTAQPNSSVVMRYQYPPVHQVFYELYFPELECTDGISHPRPPQLTIPLHFGAPNYTYTVQTVMEIAVDNDPSYQFTVTYYGRRQGYEIDVINGTENHENCTWHFFYQLPRMPRSKAQLEGNISYFTVEANSTIIMSFQKKMLPPQPSPSPIPPSSSPVLPKPSSTTEDPTSSPQLPTSEPPIISPVQTSTSPALPSSVIPMPSKEPSESPTSGTTSLVQSYINLFVLVSVCLAYIVLY